LAARKDPGCFQDALIKIDIGAGPSEHSGAVLQQWLRNQIYKQYDAYKSQVSDWEHRFVAKHVSLSQAVKGEMGNNPEHPFVKYNFNVYGKIS
jgi:hypothetical protein